jgi:hypothetical protein
VNTIEENEVKTVTKTRTNMYVDTHVLAKSMEQLRSTISELEKVPEREASKKTFVELYALLHEMYSKLNKSRSVRLDYW